MSENFPTLKSSELELVDINERYLKDALACSQKIKNSEICKHAPFETEDEVKIFFKNLTKRNKDKSQHYWLIKLLEIDKVIGFFGIENLDYERRSCQISIEIIEDYFSSDIFNKVLNLFLDELFNEKKFHRVQVITSSKNEELINKLTTFGFKSEGTLRNFYKEKIHSHKGGQFVDAKIFALLNITYDYESPNSKDNDYFSQKTIVARDNLTQVQIEKKILESNNKFTIDEDDIFEKEFIESLIKNREFPFTLNEHEKFYCQSLKETKKLYEYIIFRYKFRLSGEKRVNFKYPLYMLIEPVSTCNLKCPFCFQSDNTFTRKPFMGVMKWDLFTSVVDEASQIGTRAITLGSRGEPTMHKKFTDMISYLGSKETFFELKINTNATLLSEAACHEIFKNKVNQVVVSADHYEKEQYEKLRLGANFEKILENVDRLYKIRRESYPNSSTEIRVSGVDANKNLDRDKFKSFWIKRSDHVSAGMPVERWNTYENDIIPDLVQPCKNLWDQMYVWFDGKVNPCDSDYKSYLSYGNVLDNKILDIWNSKKISEIRHMHLTNQRVDIDPCNKCGMKFE